VSVFLSMQDLTCLSSKPVPLKEPVTIETVAMGTNKPDRNLQLVYSSTSRYIYSSFLPCCEHVSRAQDGMF